jgi:hypothetical protein
MEYRRWIRLCVSWAARLLLDNVRYHRPRIGTDVHDEEAVRRQMLAFHRVLQFLHRVRIEEFPLLHLLEGVAAVKKFVSRKVHHHVTLAGSAMKGIELEPVGSAAARALCRDGAQISDASGVGKAIGILLRGAFTKRRINGTVGSSTNRGSPRATVLAPASGLRPRV